VKVYTRRGDGGETDLFGGARVPKDHLRVEAYGAVDETNAALGIAAAATAQADVRTLAAELQSRLFDLGAVLATPDPERHAKAQLPGPTAEDVDALEAHIDAFETELAPLRRFVLPGGHPAAAGFHLARTVCRRAERRAITLARVETVDPLVIRFLNRLSDLLFVLARVENHRAGLPDVEWEGKPRRS
jgi:cob(I)alamin adenosyltransferase